MYCERVVSKCCLSSGSTHARKLLGCVCHTTVQVPRKLWSNNTAGGTCNINASQHRVWIQALTYHQVPWKLCLQASKERSRNPSTCSNTSQCRNPVISDQRSISGPRQICRFPRYEGKWLSPKVSVSIVSLQKFHQMKQAYAQRGRYTQQAAMLDDLSSRVLHTEWAGFGHKS